MSLNQNEIKNSSNENHNVTKSKERQKEMDIKIEDVLKSVWLKCLERSNWDKNEVIECPIPDCPLFKLRLEYLKWKKDNEIRPKRKTRIKRRKSKIQKTPVKQ
jgi:hypothetical protein